MLTYSLSKNNPVPLYSQLYSFVKGDIFAGRLIPGEKLPSKRSLSEHLNVSVMTVQNAYARLLEEGYISSKEKSGYFVSAEAAAGGDISFAKEAPDFEEPEEKRFTADFGSDSPETRLFPFSVWARLMRQVLSEKDAFLLERLPPSGVYELRLAISRYLYRVSGISAEPRRIVVGAGTDFLYNLIIQLIGCDRLFAAENPGYTKMAHIAALCSTKMCGIPVDGGGLIPGHLLSSGADAVHVSPSHSFPTGAVMPLKRRAELIKWASSGENRYIIEDEYDSEFRFSGHPLPAIMSGCPQTIYVNSFSKTLAPSFRISYMVLPESLCERYERDFGFYSCTVPAFSQYTLARFISQGYLERHISRMKKYYRGKRDSVLDMLYRAGLPAESVSEKDSGLHFIVKTDPAYSDDEIKSAAKKLGIRVSFVSDYLMPGSDRTEYSGKMIVNYTGLDMASLSDRTVKELVGLCGGKCV